LDSIEEPARAIPRKKRRDTPLVTLPGLIREAARIYRKMKAGKLDHEEGRSLIWSLSQIRPMIEAQRLEEMHARLEELAARAAARSAQGYGHLGNGEPLRLSN
jgi:hypothetical protein